MTQLSIVVQFNLNSAQDSFPKIKAIIDDFRFDDSLVGFDFVTIEMDKPEKVSEVEDEENKEVKGETNGNSENQ